MAKLEIEHRILIQEESIKKTDLPQEVQEKIAEFNELVDEYKEKPTDELQAEIIDFDAEICDDIQDWIDAETGLDKGEYMKEEEGAAASTESKEEESEEESSEDEGEGNTPVAKKEKVVQKPVAKATPAEKKVVEAPPAPVAAAAPAPVVVEAPAAPAAKDQPEINPYERMVREHLKANVISESELTRILGREPEHPVQVVGALRLRKQYLKPYYEVQ